jgi:hypothetical protein
MDNLVSTVAEYNISRAKVIMAGQGSFKIKTTAIRIAVKVQEGRAYSSESPGRRP